MVKILNKYAGNKKIKTEGHKNLTKFIVYAIFGSSESLWYLK